MPYTNKPVENFRKKQQLSAVYFADFRIFTGEKKDYIENLQNTKLITHHLRITFLAQSVDIGSPFGQNIFYGTLPMEYCVQNIQTHVHIIKDHGSRWDNSPCTVKNFLR